MLKIIGIIVLALTGFGAAGGAAFAGTPAKPISISAGDLHRALQELIRETGAQLMYDQDKVEGVHTSGVTDAKTAEAAVAVLLVGTPLEFSIDSTGAMLIVESRTTASAGTKQREGIEEIIVTATRRAQRAQDVAATLQVFSGRELEKNGADGFADYLATVPGLSFRDQGNGANKITLRGISNFAASDGAAGPVSTTGIYVNDIAVQGTSVAPDLALYDVQRIEVLKGPQGTLYGDGAMGGAIKMVLNEPNPSAFEGKSDVSLSSTGRGGFNWRARGAINVPLVEDRVALRLVGTYLDEDGFVDNVNVSRAQKNFDGKEVYSLRGLLHAGITDSLSAEVLALHNALDQDDFPQIQKALGEYRINSAEDRYNEIEATLLALTLKKTFDFAELSSITSHYTLDRDSVDYVIFGAPTFRAYAPVTQEPFRASPEVRSVTQELRLVSAGDKRFDWIAGAFYRDRRQLAPSYAQVAAGNLAALNVALAAASQVQIPSDGVYFRALTDVSAKQYALYGEGNFEITDRMEFTLGLRWYDEETTAITTTTGYSLFASSTSAPVTIPMQETGVIPKFALSYELSEQNKLYAQIAKGFRSGVPNLNFFLGGDEGGDSDSLWSYEIGSKNSVLNGRAILNASVFYLDWKGLQALAILPTRAGVSGSFIDNAGDGEVYGFETEFNESLTDSFRMGAAVGYTHTELTRTLGTGLLGSVLPQAPEWTASANAEYRVPMAFADAFARLDVQHTSKQNTSLVQVNAAGAITNAGLPLNASTTGNLKFGLEKPGEWGVTLFVDNLWNERAELGRGRGTLGGQADPDRISMSRPRTVGLMIAKDF